MVCDQSKSFPDEVVSEVLYSPDGCDAFQLSGSIVGFGSAGGASCICDDMFSIVMILS